MLSSCCWDDLLLLLSSLGAALMFGAAFHFPEATLLMWSASDLVLQQGDCQAKFVFSGLYRTRGCGVVSVTSQLAFYRIATQRIILFCSCRDHAAAS